MLQVIHKELHQLAGGQTAEQLMCLFKIREQQIITTSPINKVWR